MAKTQFQLGGQALVEGVMMRGPTHVGAAVRRADGSITTRVEPFTSLLKRYPILNLPLVRGVFALLEMLKLGTGYLNWSSHFALEYEKHPGEEAAPVEDALTGAPLVTEWVKSDTPHDKNADGPKIPLFALILTIAASLAFGTAIFVALPNLVTHFAFKPLIGNETRPQIVALTFVEGGVKLLIFVAYIWLIGQRKAIRRVFEYHGAEHKVVYAVENDQPLSPEGARPFDTPHPRCGTGFALLTVFVGIFCYSFLPWPDNHFLRVGARMLCLPLIAGIAFELIKATINPRLSALALLVSRPGMWLQRLTTREPNDAQLEVACEAMRVLLAAEARQNPDTPEVVDGAILSPEELKNQANARKSEAAGPAV